MQVRKCVGNVTYTRSHFIVLGLRVQVCRKGRAHTHTHTHTHTNTHTRSKFCFVIESLPAASSCAPEPAYTNWLLPVAGQSRSQVRLLTEGCFPLYFLVLVGGRPIASLVLPTPFLREPAQCTLVTTPFTILILQSKACTVYTGDYSLLFFIPFYFPSPSIFLFAHHSFFLIKACNPQS